MTTSISLAYSDLKLTVRCGRCMGCRLDRARVWAIRCFHEAAMHDENSFLTITYNDQNLPFGGTLKREDLIKFHKRLRKKVPKLRVFYCGEYGSTTYRPHYHSLLFGYRPRDGELLRQTPEPLYSTKYLSEIWGKGDITFGDITFKSAAYVAGYITKKVTGKHAEQHYQTFDPETGEIYQLTPEFSGQSRKPGIGEPWLRKFGNDAYLKDEIIINGIPMRPPRYYDKQMEKLNPELWNKTRAARAKQNHRQVVKQTDDKGFTRIGTLLEPPQTYYGTSRQMFAKNKITLSKQTKRNETK